MTEPTVSIEDRVARLEKLLDRAIDYGRKTAFGRAVLKQLGVDDA